MCVCAIFVCTIISFYLRYSRIQFSRKRLITEHCGVALPVAFCGVEVDSHGGFAVVPDLAAVLQRMVGGKAVAVANTYLLFRNFRSTSLRLRDFQLLTSSIYRITYTHAHTQGRGYYAYLQAYVQLLHIYTYILYIHIPYIRYKEHWGFRCHTWFSFPPSSSFPAMSWWRACKFHQKFIILLHLADAGALPRWLSAFATS